MHVTVKTNLRAATANLKKIEERFEVLREAATTESMVAIKLTAWRLSGGTTSQKQLDRDNHPYGYGLSNKRGPRGPVPYGDAAIINFQTGDFATGWHIKAERVDDTTTITLFNSSKDAQFIADSGTDASMMRLRPILQRIHDIEDAAFVRRFQNALTRALSTN